MPPEVARRAEVVAVHLDPAALNRDERSAVLERPNHLRRAHDQIWANRETGLSGPIQSEADVAA